MVFCVKYRRGLLRVEERCDYLKQIFHEIGQRYWFEMEEMGTDGDHVHLFFLSPSENKIRIKNYALALDRIALMVILFASTQLQ